MCSLGGGGRGIQSGIIGIQHKNFQASHRLVDNKLFPNALICHYNRCVKVISILRHLLNRKRGLPKIESMSVYKQIK